MMMDRPGPAPAARALLTLLVLSALLSPGSDARKAKRQPKQQQQQQRQHAVAAAGAGAASEPPAPMVSQQAEGPVVRHLFSTPLYVANVSAELDVGALHALALDGYSAIESSPELQQKLRELKRQMHGHTDATLAATIDDDSVFTTNDKFFFYQMGNDARCSDGPQKECADRRWDEYFVSPALKQLEAVIEAALPAYLGALGVAGAAAIPPHHIKLWASVMLPGASHAPHGETSCPHFAEKVAGDGRKLSGACLPQSTTRAANALPPASSTPPHPRAPAPSASPTTGSTLGATRLRSLERRMTCSRSRARSSCERITCDPSSLSAEQLTPQQPPFLPPSQQTGNSPRA